MPKASHNFHFLFKQNSGFLVEISFFVLGRIKFLLVVLYNLDSCLYFIRRGP